MSGGAAAEARELFHARYQTDNLKETGLPAVVGIIIVIVFWRFLVLTAGEVFTQAGLPPEAARFEARSALTGAGYTTNEAEMVVRDPAARNAASLLFLLGFIGPATVLGLFGFGFLVPTEDSQAAEWTVLIGSLVVLWVLERIGLITRVSRMPARLAAHLLFRSQVTEIWTVIGDHAFGAVRVPPDSAFVHQRARSLFHERDVMVLAIERPANSEAERIVRPQDDTEVQPGDQLIVFGKRTELDHLREIPSDD